MADDLSDPSSDDAFAALLRAVAEAPAVPLRRDEEGSANRRVGQIMGRYRIEARLGAGGMGVVYRAVDERLQRPVALKVLPLDLAHDERRSRLMLREAQSAAAVNHPHVAAIYDVGEPPDEAFIAMELVEGQRLSDRLPPTGLPWSKALEWSIQIAAGLSCAHAAGIIHRDLKPANLMIDRRDRVKILDFGLARSVGDGLDLQPAGTRPDDPTQSRAIHTVFEGAGTRLYMAPEQAAGESIGPQADIYAFGVTLIEMLLGHPPSVNAERPKPSWTPPPRTPRRIVQIVERCVSVDPGRRYADGAALHAELDACCRRFKLRRRSAQAVVIASLIALVGVVTLADEENHGRLPPESSLEPPSGPCCINRPGHELRPDPAHVTQR